MVSYKTVTRLVNGVPTEVKVQVADGWKNMMAGTAQDRVVDKPKMSVQARHKVMQELYVGRRHNLANNNSWPEPDRERFKRWIAGFCKPPEDYDKPTMVHWK